MGRSAWIDRSLRRGRSVARVARRSSGRPTDTFGRAMSRFSEPQDPVFRSLNTSLGFDRRLWHHDVAQSRAHARMLAAQQIIGDDDRDALLAALDAVQDELASDAFPFAADDEDI